MSDSSSAGTIADSSSADTRADSSSADTRADSSPLIVVRGSLIVFEARKLEKEIEITRESLFKAMEIAAEEHEGSATTVHFSIEFHESVHNELCGMYSRLVTGHHVGKKGTFSKILPGPGGIGKTVCLRNFACCRTFSSVQCSVVICVTVWFYCKQKHLDGTATR